jgi:hypothetical protein
MEKRGGKRAAYEMTSTVVGITTVVVDERIAIEVVPGTETVAAVVVSKTCAINVHSVDHSGHGNRRSRTHGTTNCDDSDRDNFGLRNRMSTCGRNDHIAADSCSDAGKNCRGEEGALRQGCNIRLDAQIVEVAVVASTSTSVIDVVFTIVVVGETKAVEVVKSVDRM